MTMSPSIGAETLGCFEKNEEKIDKNLRVVPDWRHKLGSEK